MEMEATWHEQLEGGSILRSLTILDAPLVASWLQYHSSKSAALVARPIDIDGGVACLLGIEVDGELLARILGYEGGSLGVLYKYVVEEYRRRDSSIGRATRRTRGLYCGRKYSAGSSLFQTWRGTYRG